MRLKTALLSGVLPLAIAAYSHAEILPASQTSNSWFSDGKALTENKAGNTANNSSAKNVILFVGDGMGISTLTAARILQGQQNGQTGEENFLSFESFPYSALVKTYNVDAQTPDSAGTMTAMISGVKTDAGVIGVSEAVERGDCESAQQNPLITAIELAELKGLATGIISTARITHATPAAAYAKSADRNWEDISDMPAAAIDAGCEDIASQLINFESNLETRIDGADVDGIDVVMGGGRRHFLPKDASANSPDALSSVEGDRTDSRNLVTEWQSQYSDGVYVYDEDGFNAVDAASTNRLFGLFNESHMQYEADRANDVAGEPSLSAMTGKAIDILAKNNNGYMMVVESGRIDHGHHAGSAYSALTDAIEFANAVQTAIDNTNPDETLILVTADHSHVFTIAGYPKRGNPILGKVVSVGKTTPELAADGMPYTTLGYTNGLGFRALGSETDGDASYSAGPDTGRKDLSSVDTTSTGYHQEALVPLGSETHAGEDISLHAMGPGASKVQGVIEQNVVFHVINQALGLIDAE
ncbi:MULTISPECIES: alkaline phosphatase [Spongiibacter]|uniref:alkaline phosphatase n=1 Tax=Spongiibacter TaxID=630749 RepID=UPI000C4C8250|nr:MULTISPECIES: alkaline phosphatase [Spongiibacter]MAY40039.1 alkaline phosphatase [Spongiibacter sp.]MBI58825.1 alkaline phosphatase [Spongiibacter sp.]|tara:strand:- start:295 stop:1884 length:1590 start_codon:yes stop_codon:yes gene_type:complete